MRYPDLLATKRGRLAAFFGLYLAEGLPHGFTQTAVVKQMSDQGLDEARVSAFAALILLPWMCKWAVAPFVDVVSSEKWGRRRVWIVGTQCLMTATLIVALPVELSAELKCFTFLMLLLNFFSATQDVAIDALACGVLKEEERGLANGLMYAGAFAGAAVGGSGALLVVAWLGFQPAFVFVAACILVITLLVALPLREKPESPRPKPAGSPCAAALAEIRQFVVDAARAFFGTRAAFVGMVFALLPHGAFALSLPIRITLATRLGMDKSTVAVLEGIVGTVNGVACVVGGYLSDRFGRKRMLALYLVGTAVPTLGLAAVLQTSQWETPGDPAAAVGGSLLIALWAAMLVYAVFQGLMYGTRIALFMDITTPAVAATQFTAYMSLLNVTISYSTVWTGYAAKNWGYPLTLSLDAVLGLLCIALLPLMSMRPREE
ncbi:MAG: MFS transporter [Pirellulales bacterium]|nr:MFS transporter [Pirellulales bacterium]